MTESLLQLVLGQSRSLPCPIVQVDEMLRAEGVIAILEQLPQKATNEVGGRLRVSFLVIEVDAEHRHLGILVVLP